jgi:hypothetical protein
MCASVGVDTEMIDLLLERGAKINQGDEVIHIHIIKCAFEKWVQIGGIDSTAHTNFYFSNS